MDLHRALRMTGTVLYCATVGVVVVGFGVILSRELGSTSAVRNIVPILVGSVVTFWAGFTADRVLPWLRSSR